MWVWISSKLSQQLFSTIHSFFREETRVLQGRKASTSITVNPLHSTVVGRRPLVIGNQKSCSNNRNFTPEVWHRCAQKCWCLGNKHFSEEMELGDTWTKKQVYCCTTCIAGYIWSGWKPEEVAVQVIVWFNHTPVAFVLLIPLYSIQSFHWLPEFADECLKGILWSIACLVSLSGAKFLSFAQQDLKDQENIGLLGSPSSPWLVCATG